MNPIQRNDYSNSIEQPYSPPHTEEAAPSSKTDYQSTSEPYAETEKSILIEEQSIKSSEEVQSFNPREREKDPVDLEIEKTKIDFLHITKALMMTMITDSLDREKDSTKTGPSFYEKYFENLTKIADCPELAISELLGNTESELYQEHNIHYNELEEIIVQLVQDFISSHCKQSSEGFLRDLKEYRESTIKTLTSFLQDPTLIRQSKREIQDLYLNKGVCFGATTAYSINKLEGKEIEGLRPTSQARYIQSLYNLEKMHQDHNRERLERILQEKYQRDYFSLSRQSGSTQPTPHELDPVFMKRKEQSIKTIRKIMDDANIPQKILSQHSLKISHYSKWFNTNTYNLDSGNFRNSAFSLLYLFRRLTEVIKNVQKESSAHFILQVSKCLVHSENELENMLLSEVFDIAEIERKTNQILGEDAPQDIKDKVFTNLYFKSSQKKNQSTAQQSEKFIREDGHAIYLSLKPPYQIMDVNFPGNTKFTTNDPDIFKINLAFWFAMCPFSFALGMWQVNKKPSENSSKEEVALPQ